MKNTYAVSLACTFGVTVEVEAANEIEASRKALELAQPGKPLEWEREEGVAVVGTILLAHADRDAAKLEAMLNVLRNNGFEVNERRSCYYIHGSAGKLIGYEAVGTTPEEIPVLHNINCSDYAEGLTPDNFFAEWKKAVTSFDPAAETLEALEGLPPVDAANCLRDTLEDYDAYAYQLRAVTSKMQKAMLAFDQKGDA